LSFRSSILEEFAGDLEYHPRRAALYLILAAAAFSFFYFTPPDRKFTPTPIVFALGAITLRLKGVFLLRKSLPLRLPYRGAGTVGSQKPPNPLKRRFCPVYEHLQSRLSDDVDQATTSVASLVIGRRVK